MSGQLAVRVSCRQIGVADLPAIVDLLYAGFPNRSQMYWREGLQRLAAYKSPDGVPKFGYMLESAGVPVGALLLIFSTGIDEPRPRLRCNVSSWFVRPEFRAYAPLLVLRAIKNKAWTHINVWPAQHTVPIIEAQGFTRAGGGYFVGLPAVSRARCAAKIRWQPEQWSQITAISPAERRLLTDHERFGCICLWCEANTLGQPFIFRRRLTRVGHLPYAMLIYCRSLEDLERFAGPIGCFLAFRGMPVMLASADRPLRGIVGRYFPTKLPIYFKGPQKPTSGDLSYTDAALFGI